MVLAGKNEGRSPRSMVPGFLGVSSGGGGGLKIVVVSNLESQGCAGEGGMSPIGDNSGVAPSGVGWDTLGSGLSRGTMAFRGRPLKSPSGRTGGRESEGDGSSGSLLLGFKEGERGALSS